MASSVAHRRDRVPSDHRRCPRDGLVHGPARGSDRARSRASRPRSAERGVNITGIVGVAEDTDGALMLTTSDAAATRDAFERARPGVRGARPDRRHATRARCPSTTCAPVRPVAARSADRPLPMPRRPAAITAAIRFDVVDATGGDAPRSPRPSPRSAAACGPCARSAARRRPAARRDRARGRGRRRGRPASRPSMGTRTSGPIQLTRALERVFGKRVIVIGGGAQVAQVALGAVSEADRHNLRGERISVDTIPLVGEANIAAAVRAVADLPRARLLVLAGSIMGGDISARRPRAARRRASRSSPSTWSARSPSTSTSSSRTRSRPGTMAVMAIADTATFDLARQRGRRY